MTTSTSTRPLPDFVFLRPPTPAVAVQVAEEEVTDSFRDANTPPPQRIAQIVKMWLEALEGRRPIDHLRRAPFGERVLEQLRVRRHVRPEPTSGRVEKGGVNNKPAHSAQRGRLCSLLRIGADGREGAGDCGQHVTAHAKAPRGAASTAQLRAARGQGLGYR